MTRLYDDGRKNEAAFEAMLDRLPGQISTSSSWGPVGIPSSIECGISASPVELHPAFDLERYWELMPTLDYYVYFGHDEGSMGFVDAIASGVETIVTPQGYHLDVEDGITHPIDTLDESGLDPEENCRRSTTTGCQGVRGKRGRNYAEKQPRRCGRTSWCTELRRKLAAEKAIPGSSRDGNRASNRLRHTRLQAPGAISVEDRENVDPATHENTEEIIEPKSW